MKDKNQTHYFEVKDLVNQFCSAFDSIIINRYKGETKQGDLRVRFLYAPKQRVLHSLVNKAEHITIPAIAISVSNVEWDQNRVFNKNYSHFLNEGNQSREIRTPVPVNITINMSIIARYQEDLDQILANFIPYTNPYIVISWKVPEEFTGGETVELRQKVLWSGSVSVNQPTEMGEADKYRVIGDTTFTIEGWLFKRHPDSAIGNIYEIDTRWTTFNDTLIEIDDILSSASLSDQYQIDELSLSAYPEFTFTPGKYDYDNLTSTEGTYYVQGTSPTHKIEGKNFSYTTGIYLSSDDANMWTEPLSSYSRFNGLLLSSSEYTIVGDNVIYVDVRTLDETGAFTIIVENPAGFNSIFPIEVVSV